MADRVTLFAKDGGEYSTGVPAEATRLRAVGYSDTRPFVPAEHPVPEVVEHLKEHPEAAPQVHAAEKVTRARKGVLDA